MKSILATAVLLATLFAEAKTFKSFKENLMLSSLNSIQCPTFSSFEEASDFAESLSCSDIIKTACIQEYLASLAYNSNLEWGKSALAMAEYNNLIRFQASCMSNSN